ncbi:hypothetical protein RhiirA4_392646 [Rhizophagus irregularis]|uniref:HMG box domain-containing protein n=1 Tax=Rhizophagus irregularis TaxID=588596 RepID=A0A2I1FX48_9GLOM|nr:hypothetical protein RhiirA4_392646 [Rhizophagus irregularis]
MENLLINIMWKEKSVPNKKNKKERKGPNAFLIYLKEIRKASPKAKAREISVIAGEGWKNLTPNEKNKYYKLAEEAKRHEIKKIIKQKKEHPYKLEIDAHFSEEGDKSPSSSNIINTIEIPSDTLEIPSGTLEIPSDTYEPFIFDLFF